LQKTFSEGPQEWISEIDGKKFRAHTTPIYGSNGQATNIVGSVDDMTEMLGLQSKLEDALQKSEAAQLTASAMFEANPHINILFDSSFKPIDCNPAACKLMGFDTEEALLEGLLPRIIQAIPQIQSDGRPSVPLLDRLTAAVKDGYVKFETELHLGDGVRILDVELRKIPYGDGFAVVGYLYDMTEAREREMELIRRDKQLEEAVEIANAASRSKSSFLANMSHEIRTPMNAIIGMTAIGLSTDDIIRTKDCFKKIDGASKHLLGVINDILDVSKIESGRLELSETEYEFKKMLEKVEIVNKFRIDEKKQKFEMDIDGNIPNFLVGDDQRLAQVITNLISNAVKFTPDKGSIKLEARYMGEEDGICGIKISIIDSGIGISLEQQAKLFKPFQQAENSTSRKYGGTGLGLTISKSIVEMMGGRIWIESQPGEGATFTFVVQMKRGADKQETEKVHDEPLDRFKGRRVLLAEDVEINREIVQVLLEPTCLEIICAENGKRALEMFEAEPDRYDLIFMDVQMPEMDGLEATRQIRASSAANAKTIPIIAMTANAFKEDVMNCLDAGMDDHLAKPLNIEEALEKLRTFLGSGTSSGVVWDKELELGNDQVDRQHKSLFEIINNLIRQCERKQGHVAVREALGFLAEYTIRHFDCEEALQIETKYPEFEKHKQLHRELKLTVGKLMQRYEDSGTSDALLNDIRESVISWVVNHIQVEDKKIGIHIRNLND